MIDVPPRAGAARAACGWAGVIGAEGAHLGPVTLCSRVSHLRQQSRQHERQFGQAQNCSLRQKFRTYPQFVR